VIDEKVWLTGYRDSVLPWYFYIKSNIFIADALDSWVDADYNRLCAEEGYITALQEAKRRDGEKLLKSLEGLRSELDEF
jgi:hypothetical protein